MKGSTTLQMEGNDATPTTIYSRKDPPRRGLEKFKRKGKKGIRNKEFCNPKALLS